MSRLYRESVDQLIGNTPLLNIKTVSEHANLYAKLEFHNPGMSVKDRVALNIIRDAEKNGRLKKGSVIVEASGGNTGVSLALIGRMRGYDVIIVLPDQNNDRLRGTLKKLGAKVELTPPDEGMRGAKERVAHLCAKHQHYYTPDHFNNPSNAEIHRNTTARELMKSLGNNKIAAFVAGVGTGGTITGVGEMLKSKNPNVQIIAVEPAESPVLSGGKPGAHLISGIGAGIIPPLLNRDIIDRVIQVSSDAAQKMADKLTLREGIFAGVSSGAAMCAAVKVAADMESNQNIVVFFADASIGA
ncbi:MAG: pyridoxal-phosphate dependent enzyme [Nitrospinae bacterium]|nr:pyridoxal-phosphate dependent enzyme [Nitrospinota bacterium]